MPGHPGRPRLGAPGAAGPTADLSAVDPELSQDMLLVRRLVELGRATRAESGVKTRQPLSRALVAAHGFETLCPGPARPDRRGAERQPSWPRSRRSAAPWSTPPPRPTSVRWAGVSARAPRRSPRRSPTADAAALSAALREGTAAVEVDGEPVALGPDEVIITETPREGWSVASDSGATVALDLEITPGAAPGGPGPRRDPPDPGGPQEPRPRRRRPHRAALVRRRTRRSRGRWPTTPG